MSEEFLRYMNQLLDSGEPVLWCNEKYELIVTQFLSRRQKLSFRGKEIAQRFSTSQDEKEIEKWVRTKIKSRIKSQKEYYVKTHKLLQSIGEELDMWISLKEF